METALTYQVIEVDVVSGHTYQLTEQKATAGYQKLVGALATVLVNERQNDATRSNEWK